MKTKDIQITSASKKINYAVNHLTPGAHSVQIAGIDSKIDDVNGELLNFHGCTIREGSGQKFYVVKNGKLIATTSSLAKAKEIARGSSNPNNDSKTQDPLTTKGNKIMSALKKEYGSKKGTGIFYAMRNKGKIKNVDPESMTEKKKTTDAYTIDAIRQRAWQRMKTCDVQLSSLNYYDQEFHCPNCGAHATTPYMKHNLRKRTYDSPLERRIETSEALEIGKRIGINFDSIRLDQFTIGINVEAKEHGKTAEVPIKDYNIEQAARIAWAHLVEIADYYNRLSNMENTFLSASEFPDGFKDNKLNNPFPDGTYTF
jgi:hypothetical protein